MEHALRCEQSAALDSVETTNELRARPDLDAVRVTEPMKLDVGFDHLGENPRAFGTVATRFHHAPKRAIPGKRESLLPERTPHAARDMEIGALDDRARIGAPPERRKT